MHTTNDGRESTLAPVILVKGPEDVLAERAIDTILASARAADPNTEVTRLDAKVYKPGQLDEFTSPSLFGESRLIIIDNLHQLEEDLSDDLLRYLRSPSPDVILVLRHREGARGKKVLTALRGARVHECPKTDKPAARAQLLRSDFNALGRRVTSEAVEALMDAFGTDLRELLAAARQLASDTEGEITEQTVNKYYEGRIEATGYSIADAAVAGDMSRALTLSRHALATGTAALRILSAITYKLRQLATVSTPSGTASMPGWIANRARDTLRYWTPPGLAAAIEAVAQADEEIKGAAKSPEYSLEKAIITVCSQVRR